MKELKKIGFGGGCHWCTEAVFQSLKGVVSVDQGYISSTENNSSFSEAVIVTYDPTIIILEDLIEIHLHTHKSTSAHSFRIKYRSAIYYFVTEDKSKSQGHLITLQPDFNLPIITQVLPYNEFKASREQLQNYYQKGPEKPFCKQYIHPKIDLLRKKYASFIVDK